MDRAWLRALWAVALRREIRQQGRTGSRDETADQVCGEIAEGDSVAAVTTGAHTPLAPGKGPISGSPSPEVSKVPDHCRPIRNIRLDDIAAFFAADDDAPIGRGHAWRYPRCLLRSACSGSTRPLRFAVNIFALATDLQKCEVRREPAAIEVCQRE